MLRRLQGLVDPFQSYVTATPPAGVWPFIRHHLTPFRRILAISLVFAVAGALLEVWLIGYAGGLVDRIAATPPDTLWAALGPELLLVALVVLVARPAAKLIHEGIDDIAFRPNAETMVAWRAHRHVLRQSVGWFQNDLSGRIASMVRQTGSAATGAAYQVVHTLAVVATYILASLVLMASIDAQLMIPLGLWIGLYLALMAWVIPRYRAASGAYQEAQSQLTGLMVDSYGNIDTLKLFADEADEDREARSRFDAMREAFFAVQRLEVTINISMFVLGSLLMVGLIGYAIVLWQAGSAPLGLIAASIALSVQITGMAEWLLDAVSSLFGHIGALRESLKTVAQPLDIADAKDARELKVSGGAIAFRNVVHRYGRDDGGLEGVSLDVAAGDKVGLVGRSGAGKSTLVNLLLRFHQIEAGTIAIDGQDISRVTQQSLRHAISMVAQNASLLHRSVRDNIAHGHAGATQAVIEAAAAKAHADAFIPMLRDQAGRSGYDAHVGERGVKLSGGQRQRIALARAILKDAPILVLDEATSALDSEVEAAIQDTLYDVMEGKTVIAIAHRLSTIAHMDRIVVLDRGRVAEQGTHDALLAQHGIYAGLWARQSGGFLGTEAAE
jgi:ATP-binding cassette subfamily B multidrug efflux pump